MLSFTFKNKSLSEFFAEVADAYYALFPALASDFEDGVRAHRFALKNQAAMSDDKEFLCVGSMPEHMYDFIKKAAARFLGIDDVWRDPKNMHLFFKIWSNAATKRTPTPFLAVK